jgi:uncharacterized RDD family membrane protein YckC
LVALVYEALLLFGVLWGAGLVFALVERPFNVSISRPIYQLCLLTVAGTYFVSQWSRGQTLPMKAWRLKLVTRAGRSPGPWQAAIRYLAAVGGLALFGLAFWWAIFDPDRQFLHDRIVGTRIVVC